MNTRIALIFLFINASLALKCQVCDNDGVCKDDTDNGVETDCAPEEICGYYHAVGKGNLTMRKCTEKPGAIECEETELLGVQFEACYCDSDLCNKDQGCTCGLKCQTCLGVDGTCLDSNDNGISSYCLKGQSCAYVYRDLHQLGVAVSRRCDKLPESGETCEDISDEGGQDGYICYCNEPNCNKDEQCNCESSTVSTSTSTSTSISTSTVNPDNGLKCQVCENDGVCKDDADNGVETDCAPEEICGYYHAVGEENLTMRKCTKKPGAIECEEIELLGVQFEACYCDSDLCNKDQGCTCGLKCQTCLGDDGACLDSNDNGISSYCLKGQSCAYVHQDLGNGVSSVSRRCDKLPESGETCEDISEEGLGGYICYCNEPNCNKDEQCNCESSTVATSTSTVNPDNGLKCQVCSGDDGVCSSLEDLGESQTCQDGEVCAFTIVENENEGNEGRIMYTRNCHEDTNQDCFVENPEDGVTVTQCYCDTDNCNSMSECECKTSSTTQVSTQASTTKVESGLRCQVCQLDMHMCDGESDNGNSVTCLEGEVCVKLEEGYDGDFRYYRMCEEHNPANDCEILNEDESASKKCYCDTDNCNKNDDCKSCDNHDPGINCQVCNGPEGECDNVEDIGESKECQSGEVCVFGITEFDGKTHYSRSCHEDVGEACVEEDEENFHSYKCFCSEPNCNTQRECVCGGGNNLKCQECGGEANDGMCMDQNDNGDSKTCPEGTICAYFKDVIEGETVYHRMCDTDPGEECIVDEELNSVHCFCNTDNCNADQKCNCESSTVSTSTSTVNPDNGLKCQVCGNDGRCYNLEDLGESKNCLKSEVCVFGIYVDDGEVMYTRNCHEDINQDCSVDNPEIGVTVTQCYCDTDNCNSMSECECKTSSTTQASTSKASTQASTSKVSTQGPITTLTTEGGASAMTSSLIIFAISMLFRIL